MKNCILIVVLLFSSSLMAGLPLGEFKGMGWDGKACFLEIKDIWFDHETRSPLNEKIRVEAEGIEFILEHPHHFDFGESKFIIGKNLLRGAMSRDGANFAFELDLEHLETGVEVKSYRIYDSRQGIKLCDQLVQQD